MKPASILSRKFLTRVFMLFGIQQESCGISLANGEHSHAIGGVVVRIIIDKRGDNVARFVVIGARLIEIAIHAGFDFFAAIKPGIVSTNKIGAIGWQRSPFGFQRGHKPDQAPDVVVLPGDRVSRFAVEFYRFSLACSQAGNVFALPRDRASPIGVNLFCGRVYGGKAIAVHFEFFKFGHFGGAFRVAEGTSQFFCDHLHGTFWKFALDVTTL